MAMLRLIEAYCIPVLSYAIEVIHVADRDERRQLRVAYNSVFRKIFCYHWSRSVSNCPCCKTFLNYRRGSNCVENVWILSILVQTEMKLTLSCIVT